MNIEIISGSVRAQSISIRAALALQNWLQENTKHHIGLVDCRDYKLPALEAVFKSVDTTPDELKPLAEKIFDADAFIWVSPEYNGSYSPALKNLIDHFPKQLHKPIGIVTASNGYFGGIRAAQQMILLSAAVFGVTVPQLLLVPTIESKIDVNGKIIDEKFHNSIHNFITEYLWLAEKVVS